MCRSEFGLQEHRERGWPSSRVWRLEVVWEPALNHEWAPGRQAAEQCTPRQGGGSCPHLAAGLGCVETDPLKAWGEPEARSLAFQWSS